MGRQQASEKTAADAPKRGRPQKFGRPGHVVSLTLPEDTLQALNRFDSDKGWAIVKLLEHETGGAAKAQIEPDVELVKIAANRFLIVVNQALFRSLPSVNLIPLSRNRAFLALEVGRGLSDLELVVIDRLGSNDLSDRERQALERLRHELVAWRHNRGLRFHSRAIIVVEECAPASRSRRAPLKRPRG